MSTQCLEADRSALAPCHHATIILSHKTEKGPYRNALLCNQRDNFRCSGRRPPGQEADCRRDDGRPPYSASHLPRRRLFPFTSELLQPLRQAKYAWGTTTYSYQSFSISEYHTCPPCRHSLTRFQAKIQEWIPHRTEFLHELLRLEALPGAMSCAGCGSSAVYRCISCFLGELLCEGCLVLRHANAPLHKVQVCRF